MATSIQANNGETYGVGDFVACQPKFANSNDYIARIVGFQNVKSKVKVILQWMYRVEDIKLPSLTVHPNELFYAQHWDVNDVNTIKRGVRIQFQNKENQSTFTSHLFPELFTTSSSTRAKDFDFVCSCEYDVVLHQITPLSLKLFHQPKDEKSCLPTRSSNPTRKKKKTIAEETTKTTPEEVAESEPPEIGTKMVDADEATTREQNT